MEENEKKKIDWKDLKDKIDETAKLITNLIILVQVPAVFLFLILTYYLIRNEAMPPSGLDMFVSYLMLVLVIIFFFLFCLPALMIPVIFKKNFQWDPSKIQLGKGRALNSRQSNLNEINKYLCSFYPIFKSKIYSNSKIMDYIDLGFLFCFSIFISYMISSSIHQIPLITVISYFVFWLFFQFYLVFSRSGLIVSILTHFLIFFSVLHFNLQIPTLFTVLLSVIVFIYLVMLSGIALIRIEKDKPYIAIRDLTAGGVMLILSIVYIFNNSIIPGTLRMLNLASANKEVIYLDEKLKERYGGGECVEVVWRSKEQVVLRNKEKVWIVSGDKVSFEKC